MIKLNKKTHFIKEKKNNNNKQISNYKNPRS